MSRRSRIDSTPNPTPRRRWIRWGGTTAGAAGVLAVVLLASPLTAASGFTVFSPPYTTFTSTPSNSVYSTGCGASAMEHGTPVWSSTTGTYTMAGRTSVSTCGSGGSPYAQIYATEELMSPQFNGTHGGYSSIYAEWNTSVDARAMLSVSSTGTYGWAYASVSGTVTLYVLDVTSGYGGSVATASLTLFGATLTSSGMYVLTTGWTTSALYAYAPLHRGHVYQVEIDIYVGAYVDVYNSTATGSASVNLAGTHGITLSDITVY